MILKKNYPNNSKAVVAQLWPVMYLSGFSNIDLFCRGIELGVAVFKESSDMKRNKVTRVIYSV